MGHTFMMSTENVKFHEPSPPSSLLIRPPEIFFSSKVHQIPHLIEADCGFIIPTIMSLWEDTSVTLYNSLHSKG